MYIDVRRCTSQRAAKASRAARKGCSEKKSMKKYAYCLAAYILYVEVKCSMFSYSVSTNRRRLKFSKGLDCDDTKIKYA